MKIDPTLLNELLQYDKEARFNDAAICLYKLVGLDFENISNEKSIGLLDGLYKVLPSTLTVKLVFTHALLEAGLVEAAFDLLLPFFRENPQCIPAECGIIDAFSKARGFPYRSRLADWIRPEVPIDLKDYFCERPFEHFEVSNEGRVIMCCGHLISVSPGNVLENDWKEVWNSGIAQEVRQSILDGNFKFCNKAHCPYILQRRLPKRSELQGRYLQYVKNNQTISDAPQTVFMSYDQTCNLACPSCRSELIGAKGEAIKRYMSITENTVIPALENAEFLYMNGVGDVFSSKCCKKVLSIIDRKKNKDLKIRFVSNGQLFNQKNWGEFLNIHGMLDEVSISLDSTIKDTYERLRWPGKFDNIMKNLDFLSDLHKQGQIKTFKISMVYQRENYKEMPEFIKFGKRLGCDNVIFMRLLNWGTYDVGDYMDRTVFLPHHDEHKEFIRIINQDIFRDDIVIDDFSDDFLNSGADSKE